MPAYAYIPGKLKTRLHLVDPQGRTYCQAENSSSRLIYTDDASSIDRLICLCCIDVKSQRESLETVDA
jgi:hypothetical protein